MEKTRIAFGIQYGEAEGKAAEAFKYCWEVDGQVHVPIITDTRNYKCIFSLYSLGPKEFINR